jgi:transposase-like protein
MRYTPEFRAYAVAAVHEGRSVQTTSHDLGIDHWTISRWLKEDRRPAGRKPKPAKPPKPGKGEPRKLELFKAPHARRWSARLRFSDGSKTTMETQYTDERKAQMRAVVAWTNLARAKGLIGPKTMPRRTPATVEEEPAPKAFGREKPRGHAVIARAAERQVRAPVDIQKANRTRALVDVLSVLEHLAPGDAVWVLRAAAGVADVNMREQESQGRNGRAEWADVAMRELERMGGSR